MRKLFKRSEYFCKSIIIVDFKGSLDAIQSPEEALRLLTKAMEHEPLTHMYKDFTVFQLERALEDVQSAEGQLKSAEEYICSIIDAIGCLRFMVEFIDSITVAVVKKHDGMFPNILYINLLTTVFIRKPYHLSVVFSCHFFTP